MPHSPSDLGAEECPLLLRATTVYYQCHRHIQPWGTTSMISALIWRWEQGGDADAGYLQNGVIKLWAAMYLDFYCKFCTLFTFHSRFMLTWPHGIDVSQLCKKPELVSIVLKKEESLHVCCSGHHCHHAFCGTWMLLSFHGSSGYSASGVNNLSTHTLAHSNHSTIFQQKTLKINSPCSDHKHSEFFKIWFGQ